MVEHLQWTIRFGFFSAFLTGIFAASSEASPQKIYQKVLPSVMTLEIENQAGEKFVGTAVLALAPDVAVSAWHVVCDARTVWATFADGTRVKVVGCIDKDGDKDLALLKLEKKVRGRCATLNIEVQNVATRAYVIGAPKGYGFSITDGLVSQIRRVDGFPQYQVSCPISPGNSGGPVLDERGRVIGIVSWTKTDAQNMSFAIPTREIFALNAALPVTPWENLSATARPPLPLHRVDSDRRVSSEGKAASALPRAFEQLAERLEKSAGKTITVVVQEDGEESRYTFTVPQNEGGPRRGPH
jgi:S1-C subfamily serine protease